MRDQSRFSLNLNHRGMALVTVLLVMLVLTILTTGVVVIAVSNYRQSSTTVDHNQAYYVAEAGVNYQVKNFESTLDNMIALKKTSAQIDAGINTWVNASKSNSQVLATVNGLQSTFSATVDRSGNYLVISATGTVGSVSRTLTKKITLSNFVIDKAILANSILDINQADIFNGPVQILSAIPPGSVSISQNGQVSKMFIRTPVPPLTFKDVIIGCVPVPLSNMKCQTRAGVFEVVYDDSLLVLPVVTLPNQPSVSTPADKLNPYPFPGKSDSFISANGDVSITNNSVNNATYNLKSSNGTKTSFFAPSVTISDTVSGFTFDVDDQNINIVTNTLNLSASFKIAGTGTLTIFVPVSGFNFDCKQNSICGVMGNDPILGPTVANQFIVVVTGTSNSPVPLSANGGTTYMSLISKLSLDMGGNGIYNGFFISDGLNVEFAGTSGSNALIYAPKASITVSGTANITGSLIGNTFQNNNSNSTTVTYSSKFMNPPFDFLGPYRNNDYGATVEN